MPIKTNGYDLPEQQVKLEHNSSEYYVTLKAGSVVYVPLALTTTSGNIPNVDLVGGVNYQGGVLSGFSTTALGHVNANRVSEGNYVIKFTTGSDISSKQAILHREYYLCLEINGGYMTAYNWASKVTSNLVAVTANTTYWVVINVEGKVKTYSYSTDGTNFTTALTMTDSSLDPSTSYGYCLGRSSYQATAPFNGTIDIRRSIFPSSSLALGGVYSVGDDFLQIPQWKVVSRYFIGERIFYGITNTVDVRSYIDTTSDTKERFILPFFNAHLRTFDISLTPISDAFTSQDGFVLGHDMTYNWRENIINYQDNSMWSGNSLFPAGYIFGLPIGVVSVKDGHAAGTIKQVFNNMGFIGRTFYTLPGFTYYIPNGREQSGQPKNDVYETSLAVAYASLGNNRSFCGLKNNQTSFASRVYFSQNTQPSEANWNCWYNPETNKTKTSSDGTASATYSDMKGVRLCNFTSDGTRITGYTPVNDLVTIGNNKRYMLKTTRGGVKVTKYWKYRTVPFSSPILTENGVLGGNKFAVLASSEIDTARQAWNAFDGRNDDTESGIWHSTQGMPQWYAMYNPQPFNLILFSVYNRPAYQGDTNAIGIYSLSYSNDNIDWVTVEYGSNTNTSSGDIAINTTYTSAFAKYWKIDIGSSISDTVNPNYVAIGEISFVGSIKTSEVIEGTADDYDFTTEEVVVA